MDGEIIMEIPIIIPYWDGKKLGECMNDAMEKVDDWVIFMDHDVLQLNPHWYDACKAAIDQHNHSAGWITCVTNTIGCHWQQAEKYTSINKNNDSMEYHLTVARKLWDKYNNQTRMPESYAPYSGFFMLTHKQAWKEVGGFENGWMVDNPYDEAIRKAGYQRIIMPGVYCFHTYHQKRVFHNA